MQIKLFSATLPTGWESALFQETDPSLAKVWAVGPEGITLKEGCEIFKGRTVLGGFENGKTGLLYTGSKDDIRAEAKKLVAEAGEQGLVLGADCTIPSDIAVERIQWVREALEN